MTTEAFFDKLLVYVTEYYCGSEISKARYALNEFDSLSTEEKIKDSAYYLPYIEIPVRDWPWSCCPDYHCFTSKEPKVGESCNCKQYTYREDGYCQRMIEDEYEPIIYA